jgi:hypothetical protein
MSNEMDRAVGAHEVPLGRLLFASLGAPVSWGLHLLLSYFLNALFCTTGRAGGDLAIYAVTAVFAGTALLAGWFALREWRGLGLSLTVSDAIQQPPGRVTIFLLIGIAGSVLFTLFILLAGAAPAFLPACSLSSA